MYKSIDLFAGIGGIRLGFEQAFQQNIETIFVSELDLKAQQTYQTNFGTKIKIAGDINLYKQFGNSVTVPVIKAIANQIKVILINSNSKLS